MTNFQIGQQVVITNWHKIVSVNHKFIKAEILTINNEKVVTLRVGYITDGLEHIRHENIEWEINALKPLLSEQLKQTKESIKW